MNPFELKNMIIDIKSKYRILRSYDGLSFKLQKRDNYNNWFTYGDCYTSQQGYSCFTINEIIKHRDAFINAEINEIEESWTVVE